MKIHLSGKKRAIGYTLIEALVAGVVLMIGIGAAAQLTLTLLTQEEINRRTTTILNFHENVATLYRLGFDQTEILDLLPAHPDIDSITIDEKTHDLGNGMGDMDYADVAIQFRANSSDQGWAAGLWTGGDINDMKASQMAIYRAGVPTSVQ